MNRRPESLADARRAARAASEACPHWDYEGPAYVGAPCCLRLAETEYQLATARERQRRAERGQK